MRTPLGTTIIISIMILLDFYVFSALQSVSRQLLKKTKQLFMFCTGDCCFAIAGLVLFIFTDATFMSKKVRTYLFATILAFVFAQIVSSVFFLVDDVRRIVQWIVQKVFFKKTDIVQIEGDKYSSVCISELDRFGSRNHFIR